MCTRLLFYVRSMRQNKNKRATVALKCVLIESQSRKQRGEENTEEKKNYNTDWNEFARRIHDDDSYTILTTSGTMI